MRHFLFIVIFITIGASVSSCRKNNSSKQFQLPAATHSGASTIGCNVNGKVFVPSVSCSGNSNRDELYYYIVPKNGSAASVRFVLLAKNDNFPPNSHSSLQISMDYSDSVIHGTGDVTRFMYVEYDESPDRIFSKFDNSSDRFLITKFDPSAKIISGTFDVTLYRTYASSIIDSVKITDGRFDLKIDTAFRRACSDQ